MSDRDETLASSGGAGGREPLPPGLHITLEVLEGRDKGLTFKLKETVTVLGRKNADFVLSDPTVSGTHAILEFVGGRLFITDQNSTNGTKVNGEPVESAPLSNMDVIQLGEEKILVSVVEDKFGAFLPPEVEESEESRVSLPGGEDTVVTAPLPNPELPENIQVILDVVGGPDAGKKFRLKQRSTVLGRGEEADITFNDPAVSRRHCQIEIHGKDKMTVKDLASRNGTRLNDRYISAVKVRHGDVLQIGNTVIKLLIYIRP